MSLLELLALLLLAAAVWWWLDGIRARDQAVAAAREACSDIGVQLLDDTVMAKSHKLTRAEDGRLCLLRIYGFEYSDTGNNRQDGQVSLVGGQVVSVYTGPVLLKDIGPLSEPPADH